MDLNSLRSRYALISVLLGVVVLLTAVSADSLLSHTRDETAGNIEKRSTLLNRSRGIRNAVWEASEAIGHFLIDPQIQENREHVHSVIATAIRGTEHVLSDRHLLEAEQQQRMQQIARYLQQLDTSAAQLISLRLNTNLQYPSLRLARDELLPRQQMVFDALTAAIEETGEQSFRNRRNFELYNELMDIRHRWSTIISSVRLLIASRLGSYDHDSLHSLIQNVEMHFTNFNERTAALKKIQHEPFVGFITADTIDEIIEHSAQWYASYKNMIDINASEKWRSDSLYLRSEVEPLLEKIWNELQAFDAALGNSADNDVSMLTNLAQQQSYAIWGIGMTGIFFIIIGYFRFQRSVLAPMHLLSRAFIKEASGGKQAHMPETNFTETRNLVTAFVEMRKQIHSRQEALEHQAMHDALTGLANRKLLYQELVSAIQNNNRHDDQVTLIMLDLDRFKEINDALGHQFGDQLLVSVSNRLFNLLREQDIVARLGGDEFAILLINADEQRAQSVCRKILRAFETAFDVYEQQLFVGVSLGVAVHPQHGPDAETLIRHADVAMYNAKRNRLGFTMYESGKDTEDYHLALANDLRTALNNSELEIAYQLKFDAASDEPVGVEALLRWNHPTLGNISPMQIIPIAEQLGIINRLTLWVFDHALQQCALWRENGIFLNVAVNLSVYDLQMADIVSHIQGLLDEYDVPPSYLTIEITESAMLINPAHAVEILRQIDAMGVRIAVDDFGTGFSSLSYLKKLPVDELKIDKSFVIDMINNENDAIIVRSTIDLAHNLGLKVVAEGVEDKEILELLRILRCDTVQGFYLACPADPEALALLFQDEDATPRQASQL